MAISIAAKPSARPRPALAAARRREKLRHELFPDVDQDRLWSRTKFVGFTTIPRTMPLIMTIIDSLDRRSAGRVYFDLWSRAFDDFFVEVRDEHEAAFASGYFGQRALRSWRERIEVLEKSGFIRVHKTPYGSYRYVLILDPHKVVDDLAQSGRISSEFVLALSARLISIGMLKDE